MKNKPNMYRVYYQVMEGNNYAGGWGDRTADVETLEKATQYRNIQAVHPIFVEMGEEVSREELQEAADGLKLKKEQDDKAYKIERLEKQLAQAKAD